MPVRKAIATANGVFSLRRVSSQNLADRTKPQDTLRERKKEASTSSHAQNAVDGNRQMGFQISGFVYDGLMKLTYNVSFTDKGAFDADKGSARAEVTSNIRFVTTKPL